MTERTNAEAQAKHDAAQAAKPEAERVAFAPVSPAAYLTARLHEVLASYAEAERKARVAEPENQALIDTISRRTPEEIKRIKAAIQAALSK